MIRGLIEKQDVRLLQQQAAQRNAPLLAPGQNGNVRFRRRTSQGIHGHLEAGIEIPGLGGIELFLNFALPVEKVVHLVVRHRFRELRIDLIEFPQQVDNRLDAFLDDLAHCFRWIELRLLFEQTDGKSRRYGGLALKILIDAGKDLQQRALAGSIETNDADLRAVKVREVDVLEDSFLVVVLAYSNHGVNDFVRDCAHQEGN